MAKRTYTNRRGGVTEEERLNDYMTARTNKSFTPPGLYEAGSDIRNAGRVDNGKTSIYNSSRVTKRHPDGMAGHTTQTGTIRNNKTPEQVKAQLERIRQMEAELAERDGNGRTDNYRRLQRAERATLAYSDYQALGATAG